jgi:serine phosphatase RsbU (regulator of sigma subunit)
LAKHEIRSEAFRQAALRSEQIRIIGIIAVLAVVGIFVCLRTALQPSEAQIKLLWQSMILLGSLAVYEGALLRFLRARMRAGEEPPPWTWWLSILLETALPTVAILILTGNEQFGPYSALLAPAMVAYFLFIILSTLRLSPLLCFAAGLLSALGYGSAVAYTFWRYPEPPEATTVFASPIYVTYAFLFLVGGIAAGGVAWRIRSHVVAALREAEVRRQMEQLEHDLNIARSIQQGLLPQKPLSLPGFTIAGWNQPADQTGGDYYDWQILPDGRAAISLADVTGHGIGPALVTAVCRAYSRAAFTSGDELGALIRRINTLLVEDLPSNRFITFVVGLLDPKTATVQMLSAGHGPILHFKAAEDRVEDFGAHGIPFGLDEGFDYGKPQEIVLGPGDLLVFITDGFFEWANGAGDLFGVERLKDTIRAVHHQPPDAIIAKLYEEVIAFAGGTPQADDLTAVVMQRSAGG